MDWQPIKTAPKDGTWIVVLCPDASEPGLFVVQWVEFEDGSAEWSEAIDLNLDATPIGWSPIPEVAATALQAVAKRG